MTVPLEQRVVPNGKKDILSSLFTGRQHAGVPAHVSLRHSVRLFSPNAGGKINEVQLWTARPYLGTRIDAGWLDFIREDVCQKSSSCGVCVLWCAVGDGYARK